MLTSTTLSLIKGCASERAVHSLPNSTPSAPYTDFSQTKPMRYPINCNDSQSVWTLRLNPITGTARVRWFNSPLTEYRHTHVSRRAILGMLWYSGKTSKGGWVNRHCLEKSDSKRLDWRPTLEKMALRELSTAQPMGRFSTL